MGAWFLGGLLVPYAGNLDSKFRQDLIHGSRLSALGWAPRRLLFLKLLMPYAGNLDLTISARFGSWLTPLGPEVSAYALTSFETDNAICW